MAAAFASTDDNVPPLIQIMTEEEKSDGEIKLEALVT